MNKNLLIITLAMFMLAFNSAANALAVSEIMLNSSLNQPLDAKVDILSAKPDELDSLNVSVSRMSGPSTRWPGVKVELVRVENGRSYLKITSKENVREPVLTLLLELDWSTGHIKREYSLLVNPQL